MSNVFLDGDDELITDDLNDTEPVEEAPGEYGEVVSDDPPAAPLPPDGPQNNEEG